MSHDIKLSHLSYIIVYLYQYYLYYSNYNMLVYIKKMWYDCQGENSLKETK